MGATRSTAGSGSRERRAVVRSLLGACHPGPTLAVTVLAGLLAVAADLGFSRAGLVVGAVLAGQLVTGWSNDLLDAGRDREVGRSDKPVATGALPVSTLRVATAVAVGLAVALPAAVGGVAGAPAALAGLVVPVAGVAYNLGLKATSASFVPYAVAFAALPAFVLLAGEQPVPWWMPAAGGLLGVGAHLLNVLPDLDDDAATGVRGLPHRLGVRLLRPVGVGVLLAATAVMALGAPVTGGWLVALLLAVSALAAVALRGRGRTAFRAAVGIALVDVVLLVLAGPGTGG